MFVRSSTSFRRTLPFQIRNRDVVSQFLVFLVLCLTYPRMLVLGHLGECVYHDRSGRNGVKPGCPFLPISLPGLLFVYMKIFRLVFRRGNSYTPIPRKRIVRRSIVFFYLSVGFEPLRLMSSAPHDRGHYRGSCLSASTSCSRLKGQRECAQSRQHSYTGDK
jgi:hypothetical protein